MSVISSKKSITHFPQWLVVVFVALATAAVPTAAFADPIFTPLFTALFAPVFGLGAAATTFAAGLASAIATTSISQGANCK